MPLRLEEIAIWIGGTLFGDGNVTVSNALPLQDAADEDLTLLDGSRHLARWNTSPAVAAIVPLKEAASIHSQVSKPVIGVEDVHAAFMRILQRFRPERHVERRGIDPRAVVDASAVLAEDVYIGPGATVGAGCHIDRGAIIHAGVHLMHDCRVGEESELFPGCVLYERTIVGKRVLLHANVVLGAYGFGYKSIRGVHQRTAQLGWVELEDDVEVGAGTTIDRGTYGPTRIGQGTKLDNLVQIGHNVRMGKHNLVCSQAGIAGSSSTGDYVVLGGQAGLRDHIHLGDRVMVAAQSGIANDIDSDQQVLGSPALPKREAAHIWVASQRLPEMRKEISQLRAMIAKLEATLVSATSHSKQAA